MRHLLLVMALARTHQSPPRVGMMQRILMSAGGPDPVEVFAGRFYGVSATCALNMHTRLAVVSLRGAPLGGSVSGTGWLSQEGAEAGPVVLDEEFAKRLRRRFVSVYSARLDRKAHTVTVHVKIPVIGSISLVLTRQ